MEHSRRTFLNLGAAAIAAPVSLNSSEPKLPWYRRTLRWGQTNLNELDPSRYDAGWWRQHWKRTGTQGVVINAGGIVAFPGPRGHRRFGERLVACRYRLRSGQHGRQPPRRERGPCRQVGS